MKPLLVLLFLIAAFSAVQSEPSYDSLAHQKALDLFEEGYITKSKASIMELLSETPPGTSDHIFLLSDLGNIYLHQAEYAVALNLFESALNQAQKVDGIQNDVRYPGLLFRKSTADARLKNNLAAIIGFDEVRGLYNQRYGLNHPYTIGIVLDIGDLYLSIGNPSKASSFFDEAEDALKDSLQSPNAIRAAIGRAHYYYDTQAYDQSLKLLTTTLENLNEIDGKRVNYVSVLPFASLCLAKTGALDSAQVLLQYSLSQLAEMMGTHHQSYLDTRLNYADVLWLNGQPELAFYTYQEVFDEYLRNFNLFFYGIGNQQRAIQYNRLGEIHEKLASLAEESPSALATPFLQITLTFNNIPKHLTISPDNSGKKEIEDWINEVEILWHAYQLPVSEVTKGKGSLQKKEKEVEKRFQALVKKGLLDNTGIYDVPQVSEIQSSLDSADALVEIVRYRKYDPWMEEKFTDSIRYAYLVLHPDTLRYGVNREGHTLENKYLTYYRSSIKHRFIDDYAYLNYWAPLDSLIGNSKNLTITPDGAYLQINLQTLRNPESLEYLIQEKNIKLITGMQPAYIKGDSEQRNVFIFGNPDYDAMLETPGDPPDYIALTSPAAISGMQHQREQISEHHQWSEMLYSDDLKAYEAELLESLYASSGFQTNLFLFDSAGEKEIKALQSPFTLHLSLHGYFMENQDFDPSIYQDNRLLRSGILFSGSNRFLEGDVPSLSLNDGLLTTYEIYNLNLASTSLVYLSACETGLGIVANDNAMKSFVKAFQFAGAESVIMSLWTTEPEYEIEFMNLYYYYWLFEDLSKHAAFFKAQNQMRITYERPYFWGSFILLEE